MFYVFPIVKKTEFLGASMVARQLRLHACTVEGVGSVPGGGINIAHDVALPSKKKKEEKILLE